MEGFQTYLNNQLVEEPSNLDEFQIQQLRDTEKRMIRFNYTGNLDFVGAGYDILEELYFSDPQAETTVIIVDNRKEPKIVCNGLIKISNCTFNLNRKHVSCEVDDNTFQARVLTNYKTEFTVSTIRDAFGGTMTGAVPISIELVNPETGVPLAANRNVFDWFECMETAVRFVMGYDVPIVSSWWDSLPTNERYAIASGEHLRRGSASETRPSTTFQELWEEMAKRYDLWMIFENPTSSPQIRIERRSYLHQNSVAFTMQAVADVERSINFDELYSQIKVGERAAIKGIDDTYPWPYTQLISVVEESYNIESAASVDRNYDLSTNYISDTNVLFDVLVLDPARPAGEKVTTYDERTFIFQYDTIALAAVTTDEFQTSITPTLEVYSPKILNSEVIRRHQYLADAAYSIGILGTEFESERSPFLGITQLEQSGDFAAYSVITNAFPSNIEIDDPGNNYDNTTFAYTAPLTGLYEFSFRINATYLSAEAFGPEDGIRNIRNSFRTALRVDGNQVDPVDVLVSWAGSPPAYFSQDSSDPGSVGTPFFLATEFQIGQSFEIEFRQGLWLESGAEVTMRFLHYVSLAFGALNGNSNTWQYTINNYKTTFSPGVGGVIEGASIESVYIGQYDFENSLKAQEIEALLQSPVSAIEFETGDNAIRRAYVKELSYNLVNGDTTFMLIFNRLQGNI